ncbi:hypothetical protein PhCBS80983_g03654 [Powellomyces hirtus]|uniref:Calreticulin n=1 Tax=Powellomyces hirtus TaxID=109895 RepID=A0A507E326_9FUNG|nr:hypothetical protein PhCBS80983_g03654 [Powellomyces hirtus]
MQILPPGIDARKFNGHVPSLSHNCLNVYHQPYNIMFGPDICGPNQKVHVIMNYKGKNRLMKAAIQPPLDQLSRECAILELYSTYNVLIDIELEINGSLFEDFDFFPPKEIPDPKIKKPEDWDERETIPDATDKMPGDWENGPEETPDPDDPPPSYWDKAVDGEWYRSLVPEPAPHQTSLEHQQIPNPKYNGKWVHPEIDNPEYVFDTDVYVYTSAHVGLDLWRVTSGSLFDDILFTDDVDEAKAYALETFVKGQVPEWKAKERLEEADRERIRKQKEAAEGKSGGHEEL